MLNVNLENINELITNNGFNLLSWNDRYSKGVWVCIAPYINMLEEIEEHSGAGDLDMIPATEYLLSQEWLPFVIGNDFIDALNKLEARLSKLPASDINKGSQWTYAVTEVINHLEHVSMLNTDYGGLEGKLRKISTDYNRIWTE